MHELAMLQTSYSKTDLSASNTITGALKSISNNVKSPKSTVNS